MTDRPDLVNLAKERVETRYGGDWMDTFLGPMPGAVQQPAELDEWTLTFAWTTNPLPMNGSRGNHRAHSRKVRGVRLVTMREAQYAGIPQLQHCEAQLTWYVLDGRRRDATNLALLLKPMLDGLVDAGVVPDDTPVHVHAPMPTIVRVDPHHTAAWMELVVRRWTPPS